jgi:hypothetical protein
LLFICLLQRKINFSFNYFIHNSSEARGSVVGSGTMLQAGRLWVPFPMGPLDSFNRSSRTMALGSTPSPTEMSARNFLGRGVKRCRLVWLTISPPSVSVWSSTSVSPYVSKARFFTLNTETLHSVPTYLYIFNPVCYKFHIFKSLTTSTPP